MQIQSCLNDNAADLAAWAFSFVAAGVMFQVLYFDVPLL